jgi:glycosyltransferase involved in cell wall biosynthesis
MRLCAISNKECWQDAGGNWFSSGGFPLQMAAIGSLFDEMTLVVVRRMACAGGLPLPPHARVLPLEQLPRGLVSRRLQMVARLPRDVARMAAAIRASDVVHVPLPGDVPFLAMQLALLMRKPLVARYGAAWANCLHATLARRLMRWWMTRVAGGQNLMLATGAGASPPAPRMHWIYSTAISRAEVCSVRPDLDRPLRKPARLAFVGRLAPVKGVAEVLEGLRLLRDEFHLGEGVPQVTIIGDGPQRRELETRVKTLGFQDRVRFTGQLNRVQLSQELQQADLAVQPSQSEGFCKALLDAMLCGVPVIATDVGANRQILGDRGQRGWVIPLPDARMLAYSVRRRLAEPLDWPALRRRCRDYVEQHTLEGWIERLGQLCAQQWNWRVEEGKLRP